MIENLLDLAGIDRARVRLRWVSAAEGQLFADSIRDLSSEIAALGPFEAAKFSVQLAAMEAVFNSPRIRWLTGMERQLTERENVYQKKVDEAQYVQLLRNTGETEYQKALILEVLRAGPLSVREISAKSGLPLYTVSQRLTDAEKTGQAELHGFEGTTPKFIRAAA